MIGGRKESSGVKIGIIGPVPPEPRIPTAGDFLNKQLREYSKLGCQFRFAVAYAQPSFQRILNIELLAFIKKGGLVEAVVGVDSHGTSRLALESLLSMIKPGNLYVYSNPADSTFHPKLYILSSKEKAMILIGSSNMTLGGMINNFELNVSIELDLSIKTDNSTLKRFIELFEGVKSSPSARPLTRKIVKDLAKAGILREKQPLDTESDVSSLSRKELKRIFPPTKVTRNATVLEPIRSTEFIMSLVKNDVSGKRGEPYFLIPLAARDRNPEFWNWKSGFVPSKGGRFPEKRFIYVVTVHGKRWRGSGRLYFFPEKREFRFVCDPIYGLGKRYVNTFVVIDWSDSFKVANVRHIDRKSKEYGYISSLFPGRSDSNKIWTYV